ncbi:unnamed protein product [Mortierella alpina]
MAMSMTTSRACTTLAGRWLSVSQYLYPQHRSASVAVATPARSRRCIPEAPRCFRRAYTGQKATSPSPSPSPPSPSPSPSPSPPPRTSSSSVSGERTASQFRQYAEQFKNKPASYLVSFGILHELTAVVPLPIVYFALAETGLKIPFPEQAMEEGNKFVGRVARYYGWNLEGADGARVMLNMATSYAVVK